MLQRKIDLLFEYERSCVPLLKRVFPHYPVFRISSHNNNLSTRFCISVLIPGWTEANFLWGGTTKQKKKFSAQICEILKFLLHKSKKDGGACAPSAPPVPSTLVMVMFISQKYEQIPFKNIFQTSSCNFDFLFENHFNHQKNNIHIQNSANSELSFLCWLKLQYYILFYGRGSNFITVLFLVVVISGELTKQSQNYIIANREHKNLWGVAKG